MKNLIERLAINEMFSDVTKINPRDLSNGQYLQIDLHGGRLYICDKDSIKDDLESDSENEFLEKLLKLDIYEATYDDYNDYLWVRYK